MQKIFWIYIGIIITGFILLLLPETGDALITVNDYHSPSSIDIAGLILIVVCWVIMLLTTIKRYKKISNHLSIKELLICILAIITGTTWVVISLLNNTQYAWITGAVVAVAGYSFLFYVVYKRNE